MYIVNPPEIKKKNLLVTKKNVERKRKQKGIGKKWRRHVKLLTQEENNTKESLRKEYIFLYER